MHVQSCCFALLTNCFFDVLQGFLSLSYHLLCVHLTRNKITKHVAGLGVWIFHYENRCVPLNTRKKPNCHPTEVFRVRDAGILQTVLGPIMHRP